MFQTLHKVGRGVIRREPAFVICKQTPEQIEAAKAREEKFAAEERARREEEREPQEWIDQCALIRSVPPSGVVSMESDEAIIHVEKLDDSKPIAAFVILRCSTPEFPNLPKWEIPLQGKKGLKAFFNRTSRQQILNTHHWLESDGGKVILRGRIRIIGTAASGKSLHCELVEGFRLR